MSKRSISTLNADGKMHSILEKASKQASSYGVVRAFFNTISLTTTVLTLLEDNIEDEGIKNRVRGFQTGLMFLSLAANIYTFRKSSEKLYDARLKKYAPTEEKSEESSSERTALTTFSKPLIETCNAVQISETKPNEKSDQSVIYLVLDGKSDKTKMTAYLFEDEEKKFIPHRVIEKNKVLKLMNEKKKIDVSDESFTKVAPLCGYYSSLERETPSFSFSGLVRDVGHTLAYGIYDYYLTARQKNSQKDRHQKDTIVPILGSMGGWLLGIFGTAATFSSWNNNANAKIFGTIARATAAPFSTLFSEIHAQVIEEEIKILDVIKDYTLT